MQRTLCLNDSHQPINTPLYYEDHTIPTLFRTIQSDFYVYPISLSVPDPILYNPIILALDARPLSLLFGKMNQFDKNVFFTRSVCHPCSFDPPLPPQKYKCQLPRLPPSKAEAKAEPESPGKNHNPSAPRYARSVQDMAGPDCRRQQTPCWNAKAKAKAKQKTKTQA